MYKDGAHLTWHQGCVNGESGGGSGGSDGGGSDGGDGGGLRWDQVVVAPISIVAALNLHRRRLMVVH
jgi:hypothetical protein